MVRRLPYKYREGQWLFLTWHLHGSVRPWHFPPSDKLSAGQAFVWMDRQLDTTRTGPLFLRQNAVAKIVADSLRRGEQLGHYKLGGFVIMPNHVHVMLMPKVQPSILLKALKGSTAREANLILGRTGAPFWRHETYDHWVRDANEWNRIAAYIENNPVKAQLVQRPEDYRWCSIDRSVRPAAQRMLWDN